jgi:hypothetical protein
MPQSLPVTAETILPPTPKGRRTLCLLYALAAALAVISWQGATVHFNYSGNWTALFMTGDVRPIPPELAAQTYRFHGSTGYDGQFYRYVAHAPWFRADWFTYFDSPRLRHRRILVPALAWLLAAGQDRRIDAVYIGLIVGWIFLGAYWLGLFAAEEGHSPAWGLGFLLLPATLTSIDRMTVDVALAALCVAFLRYAKKQAQGKPADAGLYLVLALVPLVRDTGALLIAAQCGYELSRKRWRRAAGFATAILPTVAWFACVFKYLPSVSTHSDRLYFLPSWLFKYPAIGIFLELFRPAVYRFGPGLNRTLQSADALALCGFLAVIAMGIWSLRRRPWDVEQWTILCFLALVLATSTPRFWAQVYSYARPFSPLILLTALGPLRRRAWWALAPLSAMALRVAIQMTPQAAGILRGLF